MRGNALLIFFFFFLQVMVNCFPNLFTHTVSSHCTFSKKDWEVSAAPLNPCILENYSGLAKSKILPVKFY